MSFWVNVLNEALITVIFAVSVNVILGVAGQLSVASVGLGGIGGYFAAYLSAKHGVAFAPALAVGTSAAFLAGLALGVPALRLSQEYVILLTLAFGIVVTAVIEAIPALEGTNGLIGIHTVSLGGPLRTPGELFRLVALITAGCLLFCWRLSSSPFGRVLRGIRDDSDATQSVGKNVIAFKILTFAWTAAVAGVAGVTLVYYNEIASPSSFNFATMTTVVAAVVVGGIASLSGAFAGAIVLTFIGPFLEKVVNIAPESATLWQLVIYGVLLVGVMRVRPEGLIPEGAWGSWVSRLAAYHHIPGERLAVEFASAPVTVLADQGGSPRAAATAADRTAVPSVRPPTTNSTLPGAAAFAPQRSERGRGDPHGGEAHGPGRAGALRPEANSQVAAVAATGLVKHFGGIVAVQDLSLELATGKVTALVGPNGAGKTTVFNLLTGRIRPDAGRVRLHGREVTGMPPHRIAALGMVRSFQDVRTLERLSLLDNVALGVLNQPGERMLNLFFAPWTVRSGERTARERSMRCLEYVGLAHRAHDLAGGLGYGDRKLLAVARLLATGGDVLLIDEPAAGIDRANLEPVLRVVERLRADGKTVCLVEHNLDVVARLSDHVLFMEEGRITEEGTMSEITQDKRLAQVYFGHV